MLTENDRRLVDGEGWRRDDLRGYWRLAAPAGGSFRITVHFKPHVPPGTIHLTIGDEMVVCTEWTNAKKPVELGTFAMPTGEFELECWRDCGRDGFRGGI